jgi:hypothetical protein
MSDRCEPPEGMREADGPHWLSHEDHAAPLVGVWSAKDGSWCIGTLTSAPARWCFRSGFRYVAPIPSHEAVTRLVEAAEGMAALYYDDEGCRDLPQYRALRAALAAIRELKL